MRARATHIRARSVTGENDVSEPLPAELEGRIVGLESGAEAGADFDVASWVWMLLLGVLLPVSLLLWGWFG